MVQGKIGGEYTRTTKCKHPWQMWDENCLQYIIKKEVAKAIERVEDFFGTKESFEFIIAKLDECMPTYKPSKQLEVLLNIK
jgi:hypothetical protein